MKIHQVKAATVNVEMVMPSMTSEVLHLLYAIAEAQAVFAEEYLKRLKGKTDHPGYQDRAEAARQIQELADKLSREYKERWTKFQNKGASS